MKNSLNMLTYFPPTCRIPALALLFSILQTLSCVSIAGFQEPHFMVVHGLNDTSAIQQLVNDSGDELPVVEAYTAADKAFTVLTAASINEIQSSLQSSGLMVDSVIEILDVNSPVRGGGVPAGVKPRNGHLTYMIQREIPGVGHLPDDKKSAVAKGSNAAIAKIGNGIEWDHSFLTDEGTYCVYRAVDERTVREHGKMIGALVLDVSVVEPVSTAIQ